MDKNKNPVLFLDDFKNIAFRSDQIINTFLNDTDSMMSLLFIHLVSTNLSVFAC